MLVSMADQRAQPGVLQFSQSCSTPPLRLVQFLDVAGERCRALLPALQHAVSRNHYVLHKCRTAPVNSLDVAGVVNHFRLGDRLGIRWAFDVPLPTEVGTK